MNSFLATTATATLLMLISGCASQGRKYDAGAVTHRMVDASGELSLKYVPANQYSQLDVVKPGDSVSIRVNAIYICDFVEDNPFPEDFTLWAQDQFLKASAKGDYPPLPCSSLGIESSKHLTRGEIVVLADVFEQGGGRTIAYSKNGFDSKDARVVFYDDDIRESGQFFSLANIPIYGPIKYSGNPLFLRIFMLELDDEENAQTSAMLKKLAELGGKAYPPASPVLKTLSSVGDALLSGEQDDLEFRYTMVFDPYPGVSTHYLPLAVGNYVLLKQEDRSIDFDWKSQTYNGSQGSFTQNSPAHRKVTFVSFKVSKNEPALQQDGLQLYSEFESTLPAAGVQLDRLTAAATVLQEEFTRASLLDSARGHVQALATSTPGTTRYIQAQTSLSAQICAAEGIAAADAKEPFRLGRHDVEYLLRSLSEACLDPTVRGTFDHWKALCAATPPPSTVCK